MKQSKMLSKRQAGARKRGRDIHGNLCRAVQVLKDLRMSDRLATGSC